MAISRQKIDEKDNLHKIATFNTLKTRPKIVSDFALRDDGTIRGPLLQWNTTNL